MPAIRVESPRVKKQTALRCGAWARARKLAPAIIGLLSLSLAACQDGTPGADGGPDAVVNADAGAGHDGGAQLDGSAGLDAGALVDAGADAGPGTVRFPRSRGQSDYAANAATWVFSSNSTGLR